MSAEKAKREFPHIFVLLIGMILLCVALTYIVPAGEYARIVVDDREIVDANSYQRVDQRPVGLSGFLASIPNGMIEAGEIIFFIFLLGGSFNVLQDTGALVAGLSRLARGTGKNSWLLVMALTFAFSMGGSLIGMCEELLVFIPLLINFALLMGYDSLTGVGIVLFGGMCGFSAAMMNPFNVGVAQAIAGLPIYSGIGMRAMMYLATLTVTLIFLMRHMKKVKNNPKLSPVYETDLKREVVSTQEGTSLTARQIGVLLVFTLSIVVMVYGVITYGWYLIEIVSVFLAMAMLAAAVGGMTLNEFGVSLGNGMTNIATGALIVGFARGVLVVLQEGMIMDTILYSSASFLSQFPAIVTAEGIYIFQSLLSFFIPSGSGQAAVTMPILTPLCDIVGVTRQTAVLGFQMADGIQEILTPTSGWFLAAIGLGKIKYQTWLKWALPLLASWYVIGFIFVAIAHTTGYGPM